MELIRLKKYTTFMEDGRSSAEYGVADKKEVMVALLVGFEPLKINDQKDFLDVDSLILKMADHIKKVKVKEAKTKVKKSLAK